MSPSMCRICPSLGWVVKVSRKRPLRFLPDNNNFDPETGLSSVVIANLGDVLVSNSSK